MSGKEAVLRCSRAAASCCCRSSIGCGELFTATAVRERVVNCASHSMVYQEDTLLIHNGMNASKQADKRKKTAMPSDLCVPLLVMTSPQWPTAQPPGHSGS